MRNEMEINAIGGSRISPQIEDAMLVAEDAKWYAKLGWPAVAKSRRREQVKIAETGARGRDVNQRAKQLLPDVLAALPIFDADEYAGAVKRCQRAAADYESALAELRDHEAGESSAESTGQWRLKLHELKHREAVLGDAYDEARQKRDRLEAELRGRLRAFVGRRIHAIDAAYRELRARQKAEILALCADRAPLEHLNLLLDRKPLEQLLEGKK